MLFRLPFSISVKTDHLTQDSFTPSRLPTCAVHFYPGDFPKAFSAGIAQTISLKNVPLHNTETLLLPRKNKLQGGRFISLYSPEVPLLQTGSTLCFYHSFLAPRVHKNRFQAPLTSSAGVNVHGTTSAFTRFTLYLCDDVPWAHKAEKLFDFPCEATCFLQQRQ